MFTRNEVENCLRDYYLKETYVKLLDMKLWHITSKNYMKYTGELGGIYSESYNDSIYIVASKVHMHYAPLILEYFTNLYGKQGKHVGFNFEIY